MSDWKKSGQQAWDRLASDDAYWAVLTDRTKNDRDLRSFFVSGYRDIERVMSVLRSLDITMDRSQALDYGCGVGRLTQALGRFFDTVTGVDVSEAMLTQARALNEESDAKLHFIHSTSFFDSEIRYDLVLSLITIQHIDPEHMPRILSHLASRVAEKGVLIVQIPSCPKGLEALHHWVRQSPLLPLHRFYSRLKGFILDRDLDQAKRQMDMNGLPVDKVKQILTSEGLTDIHVLNDQSAGPSWESYIYIARK